MGRPVLDATLKPGMQAGERAELKGHLEPIFCCRRGAGSGVPSAFLFWAHSPGAFTGRTYLLRHGRKLTKLQRHASHLHRLAPSASLTFDHPGTR